MPIPPKPEGIGYPWHIYMKDESLVRKLNRTDLEILKREYDENHKFEMSEEQFRMLGEDNSVDLKATQENYHKLLRDSYENIITILKKYLDLREEYYPIISIWIIGTYFHERFYSYPFLYFNAIKGSGKTRALNLITSLAKDGEMLLSPTEAVLFRTSGTLGIDEFEGVVGKNRPAIDSIRELLNASYKKGSKVKRMRQIKTQEGNQQSVEEFDVYRPIVMANISGMESVLGDRCIPLILEKSSNKNVTDLLELFRTETITIATKEMLEEASNQCRLCRCRFSLEVYEEWNTYITNKDSVVIYNIYNNTNNTNNTNNIQSFKTIKSMELGGRELELSFPLCLISLEIEPEDLEILKITTLILKKIFDEKKDEEINENRDILLLDFLSQEVPTTKFISFNELLQKFKDFTGCNEDWFNTKWLGRALKRMNLIINKKRIGSGRYITLNYEKAKEKIQIFKVIEKKEEKKDDK